MKDRREGEKNQNDVEESRSRAEAEKKVGQADHSLSDINPIIGFYLHPMFTGHISDSSDCWRKTDKREERVRLISDTPQVLCSQFNLK